MEIEIITYMEMDIGISSNNSDRGDGERDRSDDKNRDRCIYCRAKTGGNWGGEREKDRILSTDIVGM